MATDMSVLKVHGQCSWPPWSVFMVHVVSAHGHHVSVHFILFYFFFKSFIYPE